ncbi:MAG: hypothetical protein Q7J06_12380 [Bacteroidales bacterium]|nr:hypothetical protein [Bacteroidales bacterium]
MPALRFAAVAVGAPQVVASERRDCKIRPTFIMVDNSLGAADRTITLRDSYTPDVSDAVAVPAAQIPDKITFTVVITGCESLRDELKDIEILGDLLCYANVADAGCIITVGYEPSTE